jgi:SH3-like domain-containing protein
VATAGAFPAIAAPEGSGLPLPRFVSLRSSEVNMRAGPGLQYPIEWVFRRLDLPVEVIAEHRTWRQVRDWQGTTGWIHERMLSGRRTQIVTRDTGQLRSSSQPASPVVAIAEEGTIGRLLECPKGAPQCLVRIDDHEGWLARTAFWGIHEGETFE